MIPLWRRSPWVSALAAILVVGRVTGLRVRPRDETIGLEHLVWADPLATLLPLCGDKASRKLRETAASDPV